VSPAKAEGSMAAICAGVSDASPPVPMAANCADVSEPS
jgi:hypothetical protein